MKALFLAVLLLLGTIFTASAPPPLPPLPAPSLSAAAAAPAPVQKCLELMWDAWSTNSNVGNSLIGTRIWYGTNSHAGTTSTNRSAWDKTYLVLGYTNYAKVCDTFTNRHYFVARYVTTDGRESDDSNEISWPPPEKTNLVITVTPKRGPSMNGTFTTITNWPPISITNPPPGTLFYRYDIQRLLF